METIALAVKDLVNYVYAAGDLSSQGQGKNRAYIGTQLHQHRQNQYQPSDQKEVPIEGTIQTADHIYRLVGRMDGVLEEDGDILIEEIKSTLQPLMTLTAQEAHLKQLQVYGYLYALKHQRHTITLRLLYVHHPSLETKAFTQTYAVEVLEHETLVALETYRAWHVKILSHLYAKEKTLTGLEFPFHEMREGQERLIEKTYQTMIEKDVLYALAPTGIGKTMATLFATLKSVHRHDEKVFYATAKNAGKQVAVEMVERLRAQGVALKAITLNSKESLCLRKEVDCDPAVCPFAKNYYDRVNEALSDVFEHDALYDGALLKEYGALHKVCPHELALDVARYCDVIIGDFNYAFDPRIQLVRFFDEDNYKVKLLVDEAHNLVDRSRSMYSASLTLNQTQQWQSHLTTLTPSPMKALNSLVQEMLFVRDHAASNRERMVAFKEVPKPLHKAIEEAYKALEVLMEQHKQHRMRPVFKDAFFELLQWLRIAHYYEESHLFLVHFEQEDVRFEMACLDASKPLKTTLTEQTEGAVLFSATLEPLTYYQQLLSRGVGQTLILNSPFDPKRLGVFVDVSRSLRYKDRDHARERIGDSIYALLESKKAPYIVYFPSFQYMHQILADLDLTGVDVHRHQPNMTPTEKETLLRQFMLSTKRPKLLCTVLGGSFAEGVDLPQGQLLGVMVVGVALPALTPYQNLLQQYYTHQGYEGFHYAYTYPGMNRVIQAVGRVIRTEVDFGVAILVDDRYQTPLYQSLMPPHWAHHQLLEEEDYLQGYLHQFWQQKIGEDFDD